MNIYLAGQWARRDEIAACAVLLRADGHTVVSRWHDELMGDDSANDEAAWKRWADGDLTDVAKADTFVAFTEDLGTLARGGRHVEWGFGLAAVKGIRAGHCFIVGPCESQFYALRDAAFANALELRDGLKRLSEPYPR